MIRITQVKLPVNHSEIDLKQKIAKTLKISPNNIGAITIRKKSIDARKKPELYFIYTLDVEVEHQQQILKKKGLANVSLAPKEKYIFPPHGEVSLSKRPIIIGTGPAGLFCGLMLAKEGYRPILLERGRDVDRRVKDVDHFWLSGKLNPNSNVQFGEGGAGTFSDGKLNTLVKDTNFRNKKVLELFVEAGADPEILYINKPHIGTDVLRGVVKNIRNQIISLGGTVLFEHQVTDFIIKNNAIYGVEVNHTHVIESDVVVLAIGHSARDTFSCLYNKGIDMNAKSFAVGLRLEHPQKMINEALYGETMPPGVFAADYKVTWKTNSGRGVYSFCMCPGGYVVNASSEQGFLAINGMSNHARESRNANSAIIVTVTPEDFKTNHALAGVEFQRELETMAYQLCDGKIPVQLLEDFSNNQISKTLGDVTPCMKGEWEFANLRTLLPESISLSILEGMEGFSRMIPNFNRKDAIFSGIESRTSSPIRITRNEAFESNILGLYPCGEGAGYAGGITSAAMDGIKVAEKIAMKFKNFS